MLFVYYDLTSFLQIEAIYADLTRVVFVPYTLIRIDRAGCDYGN